MPAEKLLTSISKPGLILPSQSLSICFVSQAASGPMIIAPRNIGMFVPTMTPIDGDRRDDATALAVDHAARGVGDEQRQQVRDHRADEADVLRERVAVVGLARGPSWRPASR